MVRSMVAERWLSVGEAGRALGLSRTSLLAAEEAGLLASVRTPGGHRRYRPAELRRYLRAAGAGPEATDPPATAGAALDPAAGRSLALDLATALRAAVRPVARALAAECAGVYLLQDGALRFSAAFGVPRWLAERLASAAAPAALHRAGDAQRPQPFDPAAAAFPEPRSTGQGIAAALRHGDRLVGVLFVVRGTEDPLSPGDLRAVDAFAELLAATVADRTRIGELEYAMATIAALTRETDVRGI
jgi:GAF domain